MKNTIVFFLCLLILVSCDDGDVIVTSFDFDSDSDLQLCQTGSQNVLFVINTDPDESISFNFTDENFDGTYTDTTESQTLSFDLTSSNRLNYRKYNDALGADYFCNGVPPETPEITTSYQSKNGGYINIITALKSQSYDSIANTVTKEFKTYAVAHNVTLTESDGNEEIVEETLNLGSFTKTAVFDVDSLQVP